MMMMMMIIIIIIYYYHSSQVIYKYYDFIVIGAGSAGAVVANRLSEQPDWNVLLLEAGGDETETSDVPALAAYLQLSELDWQYKTEPQPTACLAFNDKRYSTRPALLPNHSIVNFLEKLKENISQTETGFSSFFYTFISSLLIPTLSRKIVTTGLIVIDSYRC